LQSKAGFARRNPGIRVNFIFKWTLLFVGSIAKSKLKNSYKNIVFPRETNIAPREIRESTRPV